MLDEAESRKRPKCPRVDPAEVLGRLGRLLSLREAAARLGLTKRTLERMIVRRELNVVRVGHGRGVLRVSEAELVRIIDEGKRRA